MKAPAVDLEKQELREPFLTVNPAKQVIPHVCQHVGPGISQPEGMLGPLAVQVWGGLGVPGLISWSGGVSVRMR
jgi:hypothetical protein